MNHIRGPINQTQTFTTELKSVIQQEHIDLDYSFYFRTESKIKKLSAEQVLNCYVLTDYVPKLVEDSPQQALNVNDISTYYDFKYQKSRTLVVLELESILQGIIRGSKNWPTLTSTLIYALQDYKNGRYKYDNFKLSPTGVELSNTDDFPIILEDLLTEISRNIYNTEFDTSNYELIQQFLIEQVFGQGYQSVVLTLNKKYIDNNLLEGINYYDIERQLTNLPLAYSIILQDGPTLELLKVVTIQYLMRLGNQIVDDEKLLSVNIPSVYQGKSTYNERYGIPNVVSFHTGLVLVWLWTTLFEEEKLSLV